MLIKLTKYNALLLLFRFIWHNTCQLLHIRGDLEVSEFPVYSSLRFVKKYECMTEEVR